MNRSEILKKADACVSVDRQATHGSPEDNFARLADIWSVRLGIPLRADQVAIMLSDLKTVRAWENPDHPDNWVDMAGYAACGGEISGNASRAALRAWDEDDLSPLGLSSRCRRAMSHTSLGTSPSMAAHAAAARS